MSSVAGFALALFLALSLGAKEVDTFIFEVDGMVWEECRHSVEEALKEVPGVVSVYADVLAKEVTVEAQPGKVNPERLIEVISKTRDGEHSFKAKLKKADTRQSASPPRLRPLPDLDRNVKTGPEIGTAIPRFEASDQNGKIQTLETLRGPEGLVLLFNRSADWWPFCKAQLVELEQQKEEFGKRGLGVAAVSHDTVAILRDFARRKGITYPLLPDPDSRIIRAFGILNENFPPGHQWHGVPFPGTYVLDEHGIVRAKFFEEDHRERYTAANILVRRFGDGGGTVQTVETKHLKLSASASDPVAYPGSRMVLALEVELKAGMHVYAPGVEGGYIPIEWRMAESKGWLAHGAEYPQSRKLRLAAIGETVPVYEGRFRITRDLTIGQAREFGPQLDSERRLAVDGTFRYQACDEKQCFPPQTVPLRWTFRVEQLDLQRAPAR